jgi:subtilisin-like proprotein convertase family protein
MGVQGTREFKVFHRLEVILMKTRRAILSIALLFTMTAAISAQTFSNTSSISIPNSGVSSGAASLYPSPITVSGLGTQITAISVTLDGFSHAYPADVDILLVGPNGQNVMLMSDVGTFFPVSNLTFTFDNSSANSMPGSLQLMSGIYAPTNFDPSGNVDGFPAPAPLVGPYGGSFAPFIGTDPNGVWKLYIVDDVNGNSGQLSGGWSITITTATPALNLTSAVSRKTHTGVGDFDISLPLSGSPGVECRTGASGHKLVFTFTNDMADGTATVTGGVGSVSGSPVISANTMTVNLTGVVNAQTLTVTLHGLTDTFAQSLPDTALNVNFLLGDTTGNGVVNASDVSQVKAQVGSPVMATNFRADVTTSGAINASDVNQVKINSGNFVPQTEDHSDRTFSFR